MATRQRCPKCNQLNDVGVSQCKQCGAPLIQVCPVCGTPRPWYVEQCAQCASQPNDARLFASLFEETPVQRLRDRYVISETLASGPATKVYRATDQGAANGTADQRTVVIKAFQSVALFRAIERRDAARGLEHRVAAWQAVEHPALARILDLFTSGDTQYLVMEYVRGWSLENIIAHKVPVTPLLARNWGAQIALFLEVLHHQPQPLFVPFLAPSHVMVTPEGQVKLVGLGLGALFAPTHPQPYGGTKGYVAPELAQTYPNPRSDVFAVARLLYAALIGQLLEKGIGRSVPLREAVPGISSQLVKAIAKGAHRDPDKRFATAAELADALWGEQQGTLEPIADWRQVAVEQQLTQPSVPSAAPRVVASEHQVSMADLGFRRDPRFGPQYDQPTRRPAPATTTTLRPAPAAPVPAAAPASLGAAILSLYPTRFDLPDLEPDAKKRLVLRISNRGDADLVARVESRVTWMRAPKQQVRIPSGKTAQVVLSVHADRLAGGSADEPRALAVSTNVGTQWVAAAAMVSSAPVLQVETPLLDLGDILGNAQRVTQLKLSNRGRQPMSGQIVSRVPWLSLKRSAFTCAGGATVEIPVQLVTEQLPRGEQHVTDALVIESDGGQARIAAHAWRRVPELDLGAEQMVFGDVAVGVATERYLYVGNAGDAELQGSVRSLVPQLQVWPTEIICQPGDLQQVVVTLDSTGLNDGTLRVPQAVRVQTNGGARTLGLEARIRAPKLVIDTQMLDFATVPLGQQGAQFLRLANQGSAPLEAEIASQVKWLTVQQPRLTLEPGQQLSLPVVAHTEAFDAGQQLEIVAAVRITSGSLVTDIPARLTILQPALKLEPESIDFGYVDRTRPERRSLAIVNAGTGDLAWQAQTDAEWVELEPTSGICPEGQQQKIELVGYGLAVEVAKGQQTDTLIISSDGGRAKVPLRIGLAEPMIATDMRYVDMVSVNRAPTRTALRVFNHGLGLLEGTVRSDATWLAVDRVSFHVEMGRSIELGLAADLEELPHDALAAEGQVMIESNGGEVTLQVALRVELWAKLEADTTLTVDTAREDQRLVGRLQLRNNGLASGHAELVASHPAIEISPAICDIKPGRRARVTVSLPAELQHAADALWVDIHFGNSTQRVPIEVAPATQVP